MQTAATLKLSLLTSWLSKIKLLRMESFSYPAAALAGTPGPFTVLPGRVQLFVFAVGTLFTTNA